LKTETSQPNHLKTVTNILHEQMRTTNCIACV